MIDDEALAEVMDETVAADELVTTEPLDGVTEEPAVEPVGAVRDDCVPDG